jgi:hypothetical protein
MKHATKLGVSPHLPNPTGRRASLPATTSVDDSPEVHTPLVMQLKIELHTLRTALQQQQEEVAAQGARRELENEAVSIKQSTSVQQMLLAVVATCQFVLGSSHPATLDATSCYERVERTSSRGLKALISELEAAVGAHARAHAVLIEQLAAVQADAAAAVHEIGSLKQALAEANRRCEDLASRLGESEGRQRELETEVEVHNAAAGLASSECAELESRAARMQTRIMLPEKELSVAERACQLMSMEHDVHNALNLAETGKAPADVSAAALRELESEAAAIKEASYHSALRVITSADVWCELAFLDHRRRTPHIPHPVLCCQDEDRQGLTCQLCFMLCVNPVALNNGVGTLRFKPDGSISIAALNRTHASLPCGDGPYCGACVRRHLLVSAVCPACQQPTKPEQLIEDTRMHRAVRSALVRCTFYVEGCGWTGEVRDFQAHHGACSHARRQLKPIADRDI